MLDSSKHISIVSFAPASLFLSHWKYAFNMKLYIDIIQRKFYFNLKSKFEKHFYIGKLVLLVVYIHTFALLGLNDIMHSVSQYRLLFPSNVFYVAAGLLCATPNFIFIFGLKRWMFCFSPPSKCKCWTCIALRLPNVCLFPSPSLFTPLSAHTHTCSLSSCFKQIGHLWARSKWAAILDLAPEAVRPNCSICILASCHTCHALSLRLRSALWNMLVCVRGLRRRGKLWATLFIFHMLHQCRSSDSMGLALCQTRAAELFQTISTFHLGAVLCSFQYKTLWAAMELSEGTC